MRPWRRMDNNGHASTINTAQPGIISKDYQKIFQFPHCQEPLPIIPQTDDTYLSERKAGR